jgi:PAS domain-containing protein
LIKVRKLLLEELEKEKDPRVDKKRSRTIEVEHYRADGTIIWIEMSISITRDENGYATGFLGVSRDITHRKLAELALIESERSKSLLISNLPGLAYRCKYDQDGTMLVVSHGCYALTGYMPEAFINNKDLSFNDIINPEHRDLLWREWERTVPQRIPYRCEYEIITAQGEKKWVIEMGQVFIETMGALKRWRESFLIYRIGKKWRTTFGISTSMTDLRAYTIAVT